MRRLSIKVNMVPLGRSSNFDQLHALHSMLPHNLKDWRTKWRWILTGKIRCRYTWWVPSADHPRFDRPLLTVNISNDFGWNKKKFMICLMFFKRLIFERWPWGPTWCLNFAFELLGLNFAFELLDEGRIIRNTRIYPSFPTKNMFLSAALRSNAPIMFYVGLFIYFFIHRSFSETTRPIHTKFSGIVYSSVVWIIR